MKQEIFQISIVVRDYDEAIEYYTNKLGFELLENTILTETKRWVRVAPSGADGCSLLLAQAAGEKQVTAIGNQAGGRVFLFLHTDDIMRDHKDYTERGVTFLSEPRTESYGLVCVFKDLYGNLWDLIQPNQ